MALDSEITKELAKQSGSILGKAYDDVIHPSAKSIGNTLSLLPRTIGVCFKGLEKWIINGEESIHLAAEAVNGKTAKLPEEKLTEPEPYVAIPVIQQLSYCYNCDELRELYANLLVSSMNIDTKNQVHPSFVDIIKQLSPLDAKTLERIRSIDGFLAIADICASTENDGSYFVIHENYAIDLQDIFENYEQQAASIQNLARLGLVDIDHNHWLNETDSYKRTEESQFFTSVKDNIVVEDSSQLHIYLGKGVAKLTAFGKAFCNVCCSANKTVEADQ